MTFFTTKKTQNYIVLYFFNVYYILVFSGKYTENVQILYKKCTNFIQKKSPANWRFWSTLVASRTPGIVVGALGCLLVNIRAPVRRPDLSYPSMGLSSMACSTPRRGGANHPGTGSGSENFEKSPNSQILKCLFGQKIGLDGLWMSITHSAAAFAMGVNTKHSFCD